MKRIAAFICSITLVTATMAQAAPMPWTHFSSPEMLAAGSHAGIVQCQAQVGEPKELFIAFFTNGTAVYMMIFSSDSSRIMFVYAPDGKTITEVGIGTVKADAHDTIPFLLWMPYDEGRHKDLCGLMLAGRA